MMKLKLRKFIWVITALLTGCAPPNRPSIVPMRTLDERVSCGAEMPERLIVMLPGLFDTPEDFVKNGFVSALRERGIKARVLIPDAHFGYYESRTVDQRILEDIIIPARASGAREIWLVGVSMGGLGSLIFSQQHRPLVQRIFLIGPYPGTDKVMRKIRDAGGPGPWAQLGYDNDDPDARIYAFWHWLVSRSKGPQSPPFISFGTGDSDRYRSDQQILGSLLPVTSRFDAKGGHDWRTWHKIWLQMLDALPADAKGSPGAGC
ncbi:alpha/beta fold hydrolase [Viridibacterium curvum]|uniref:AB hydrolase-1 domain-containing protein n=1 Tax=Viridibacterium curvum TaxID=1101404 RepID=A0ABP9R085_9RHOO